MRGRVQARGGLSWQIEKDARTKIFHPRIVKRPGNGSVVAVNRSLQAVHGRMILETLEHERRFRGQWATYEREALWEVDGWSVTQDVGITYASATYLSLVEIGSTAEFRARVFVRGTTIDMRDGTIFSIGPCGSDDDVATFVFADLLSVCTEAQHAQFSIR